MKDLKDKKEKPKREFEEILLEVRRVTRVTTGGRRMSFRATILVGNKKGKIGIGTAKGPDVAIAVQKASHEAYKNIFLVSINKNGSVPYAETFKYKSALIKIIPAASGTGLKAGSSVRSVLELAGYTNILSKIVGTNNRLNNALATIMLLSGFKGDKKVYTHKEESKDTAHSQEEKTENIVKKQSKATKSSE